MKPQQPVVPLVLIALLTVGAIVASVFVRPKLGLDIKGGARVVLEADTTQLPKGREWNRDTKSAVTTIISNRVNANGVAEPVITPKGDKQFVVELPAIRNEQEVLEQLQNTAQLQFYYSNDWKTQRNPLGRYLIESDNSNGNRESFNITDTTTKQTFRDLFHINLALRDLIEAGSKAGDQAVLTPLPEALAALPASQNRTSVPLTADDAKKLDPLNEELTNFDTFLKAAKLELTGSDLLPTARGGFDPGGSSKAIVNLEFNDEGRKKFGEFTRDHSQEILMIYLDGRILMAPNINEPILNGQAQISPFATVKEAKQLADYLNGGALPVPLKIVSQQSVEATLGADAVRRSLIAGLTGLGLVMLFMLAYYLLPGAIACFALLLYTLFTYAIFLLIPVTFTLPGIAGFILSVGMAVDANILIFERTKEELRDGRPLQKAIESGFQRAFSAILDSNICTAITSLLLYNFGTGPVRGFALTLLIGVIISMFTAIIVSRTFLLLLVKTGFGRNLNAWGFQRSFIPRFNIVKNRKFWYGLSLAVIVPGIIFAALGGFKLGIDFTGGSELSLKFPQNVTSAEVQKAVSAQGIQDPAAQIAGDNTVFVRLPKQNGKNEVTGAQAKQIVEGLQTQFPGVKQEEFNSIGSSISTELTRNALTSILLSSLLIVFYLAFRFALGSFVNGLKFGVAAIIAMLHDVLVLIGVFAFLGFLLNWKVDSLFVTAALTVIGFSVHDTIVIFDRMRENLRLHRGDAFEGLVDRSINETFTRSINTSFTVIITLVALLIFGGPVIRPLNAALLIGIISGTYSSIFNAAPLVVDWERLFGKRSATPIASSGGRSGGMQRTATNTGSVNERKTVPLTNGKGEDDSDRTEPQEGAARNNGYASRPRPQTPPGPPRPRKRRM